MAPRSVNSKLVDDAIKHAIYLQRYKTAQVNTIISLINREMFPGLLVNIESTITRLTDTPKHINIKTDARLRQLSGKIKEITVKGMGTAYSAIREDLIDVATTESHYQVKSIKANIPSIIKARITTVGARSITAIVDSQPFQGAILKTWFDKLASDAQFEIMRQVNTGLTSGESVPQIVRRIRGTSKAAFGDGSRGLISRRIESVVRTSISHATTNAREATYGENDEVIKGVQIVATLDSRTTLTCIEQDGMVYPVGEGWRPPGHWNCRTTTAPVTKSWKELGFNAKELPTSTRASMNGQVPEKTTYKQWILKQPAEVQKEVFGATRYELLKKGVVNIDSFVDDKSRPLTLAEIADREGLDLGNIIRR